MTVGELKESLEHFDDNMEVYAVSDYGDYTHTMQLVELDDPNVMKPYKTAYSNSGLAISEEDRDSDLDEVVVLGYV